MRYSAEQRDAIFDRTDGHCHICGKKLCWNNYGQWGRKGAWEVEHSNARGNGGTDRLNNLYAAHISCNREKGTVTTRTARKWNGRKEAPLSREKKEKIRTNNRWAWSAAGALSGATIAGPAGFVVGGLIGAVIGDQVEPE